MEYKYVDLPITPGITEELIIKLLNGQTLDRNSIVKIIIEHHKSNGGLDGKAVDFPRTVKTALNRLQNKGHAINKSYGMWQISKNDTPIQEIRIKVKEDVAKLPINKTFGIGENSIYFYYFPSYKILANNLGKESWPCKIGRTDRDPLLRILSQSSTALPENPIIEFIVKIDKAGTLESAIHNILTLRNKKTNNSPGTEWFETNPEEVIEIIKFINPTIIHE